MKKSICLFLLLLFVTPIFGQTSNSDLFTTKGISLKIPDKKNLDEFLNFINSEFPKRELNLLVLRVDYNYEFKSRPELIGNNPYSEAELKKIVKACKANNIKIVPLFNLFGHQSWHGRLGKLLTVYPEFDETPNIKLPTGKYEWPNADSLYCKSYCSRHPGVHDVVFDIVDEYMEVFEATDFHAGLDEVFYLGHDDCVRCKGMNKAQLFADEVNRIEAHLNKDNYKLWMWSDRLIDGNVIDHMWEGSTNGTYPAINLISKDIVICDWHYERAYPTAAYFAINGFPVLSCPWNQAKVGLEQKFLLNKFISEANETIKPNYMGMLHTVWSGTESFMRSVKKGEFQINNEKSQAATYNAIFPIK